MGTNMYEELEDVRHRLEDAMATNKYLEIDALLKTMVDQTKSGGVDPELVVKLKNQMEGLDENNHPRAIGVIRGALDLLGAPAE